MVVQKANRVRLLQLDLAYLGFFLGLRVNELVRKRLTKAGFRAVRDSHGYLIQHLIAADRSITELARRMEVTQQAASKAVAELIRLGILEASPARDRRAKRIRLSKRGWRCVQLARRARAQLDGRLLAVAGKQSYARAKSTVLACLTALGDVERIRSRRVRLPS